MKINHAYSKIIIIVVNTS